MSRKWAFRSTWIILAVVLLIIIIAATTIDSPARMELLGSALGKLCGAAIGIIWAIHFLAPSNETGKRERPRRSRRRDDDEEEDEEDDEPRQRPQKRRKRPSRDEE